MFYGSRDVCRILVRVVLRETEQRIPSINGIGRRETSRRDRPGKGVCVLVLNCRHPLVDKLLILAMALRRAVRPQVAIPGLQVNHRPSGCIVLGVIWRLITELWHVQLLSLCQTGSVPVWKELLSRTASRGLAR